MTTYAPELIRLIADWSMLPIIVIAAYALIFKVTRSNRYEVYARIVMAGLTAYLVAKLLGAVFQPSLLRPFELLGTEPGASFLNNPGFPSDHALFATFLVIAVWYATRSKALVLALGTFTLLMGIGRVLALVHTPLDVIGGYIIACSGLLWYRHKDKKIVK